MATLLSKTRRSTLHTLPAQVVNRILGVLYVVLLARFLTVESYGAYNFVLGALMILGFLCNLGVASSLQRFIPEYARLGRHQLMLRTLFFAHSFRTGAGLIVLVVSYLTFEQWASYFNVLEYKEPYLAFIVGAFFLFHIEYFTIGFNANFLHWATSLMQLGYTILRFILAGIVFYFGFKLTAVLVVESVAYCLAALFGVWVFYTRLYKPNREKPADESGEGIEKRRLGRYSAFNAAVIPGNIMISHSMDYFVIAAMANPIQLGLYALASRVSKMITSIMPQNILQGVIRPAFYHGYYADKNEKTLDRMFNSLVKMIAVFLFPSVIVGLVLAQPLIVLVFGADYHEAVNSFCLLLAFMIFTVLEFPSDMVLQAIEKVQARLYAQIFAVYNVVAAIYLMKRYGIEGVAFATGTALMLKCLFFYFMVRYYTDIRVEWLPIIKMLLLASLTGVAAHLLLGAAVTWSAFLLAAVAAVLMYFTLFFFINPMNFEEKTMVNEFFKRRIFPT